MPKDTSETITRMTQFTESEVANILYERLVSSERLPGSPRLGLQVTAEGFTLVQVHDGIVKKFEQAQPQWASNANNA